MISQPHISRRRLMSCQRAMKVKTARKLVMRCALAGRRERERPVWGVVLFVVVDAAPPPPSGT